MQASIDGSILGPLPDIDAYLQPIAQKLSMPEPISRLEISPKENYTFITAVLFCATLLCARALAENSAYVRVFGGLDLMPDYGYQAQEGLGGKINLDYEIGNAVDGVTGYRFAGAFR
jgi:hypothetical protein